MMLFLLPLGVCIGIGLLFLLDDNPAPVAKAAVVCWIGLSVALQFFVAVHFLVPLMMQVVASVFLLMWCKSNEVF